MKFENENGYIEFAIDECDDNALEIEQVEAFKKRQGTGNKLVNEVIEYARSNGYDKITLVAHPTDETIEFEDLIKFYENLGFTEYQNDGFCAWFEMEI